MAQLADLGRALAQLRSILGRSVDECAARVQMPPSRLMAVERGDIDQAALEGLARLYALEADALREGLITPTHDSTVFLLHGAYTDFDARDLGVLGRAMRTARMATALAVATDDGLALRRRLQFVPVGPAGPNPADAARQGYKLARLLRDRLGLGGDPIDDIAELLADKLGIVVLVDAMESTDLRAAAVLDSHRAAAAAVLAADDPHRQLNPALARVYLAHELCHILFDPGAPGSVRLVLDNNPGGRRGAPGGPSTTALLESRAKGFAAEFLLPLAGLERLLGAATSAQQMVDMARNHFGTPWEIARLHLENCGFVPWTLERKPPPGTVSTAAPTRLPEPGALPQRLVDLLRAVAPDASDALDPAAEVQREPSPDVGVARDAVRATLLAVGASVIDRAFQAVSEDRSIDAVDLLADHLDDLFLAGEFTVAQVLLDGLDTRRLPPKVLTGVLTVCSHARGELGEAYSNFLAQVEVSLRDVWLLSPEQIASVERRFR